MTCKNQVDHARMLGSLMLAGRQFPNCPIANCECHHKDKDEWVKGCYCLCHFAQMTRKFGEGKWDLGDVDSSAKAGKPRRKPGRRAPKTKSKKE